MSFILIQCLLNNVYYFSLLIENQDFGGSSQVFQSVFVAIQGCLHQLRLQFILGDLVNYQRENNSIIARHMCPKLRDTIIGVHPNSLLHQHQYLPRNDSVFVK